jgi:hypothetical protein
MTRGSSTVAINAPRGRHTGGQEAHTLFEMKF